MHANALEEGLRQLEDSDAPVGVRVFCQCAIQDLGGIRDRTGNADLWSLLQGRHRLHFQVGLVDQAVPDVGVVIRPEKRLLETPVLQVRRGGIPFQRLKLLERDIHTFVRQQPPLPVSLQGQ